MLASIPHVRHVPMRHGFSLLETVLVLSILGVVAALGLPRYAQSLTRYRVDAAAQRLANDLQTLRQRAIDHSVSATITLDANADTLSATGVGGSDQSATVYVTDFKQPPFAVDLVLSQTPLVFGFDGFGRADQSATITLVQGNYRQTINVEAGTGRIHR